MVAHRLAAALLYQASGRTSDYNRAVAGLAGDLRRHPDHHPPTDVDQLTERVQAVPGVRFGDVLADLAPDPHTRETMLSQSVQAARQHRELDPIAAQIHEWAPVITATVAAARGDQHAVQELAPLLDELAASQDWAALAAVLRRVIAGERDDTSLLDGLDTIDIAIVNAVLHSLRAQPEQPA